MFNEEKNAKKCVRAISAEIKKVDIPTVFVVVDDGSSDKTFSLLKEEQKTNKYLAVVQNKTNQGYGGALKTGVRYAETHNYSYCLFMDSDLTNSPNEIHAFVKALKSSEIDCVKASRYIPGGKMIGVPIKRYLVSYLGNIIASMLYRVGLHDCTNGFRMVKTKLIKDMSYSEKGFAVIMEELRHLKKKNATFLEIPTILTSRRVGKTNFRYNINTFYRYIRYAL
jgi:dolichol-phosphate mannosyltransferase